MQHLSSGKSRVYPCRDMLQHVVCCRKKFDRDKKCCIDKCCPTIHFFCFCSSRLVWNKCRGKMFSAFDHAKTQQYATICNRMSDRCCMLYSKSRACSHSDKEKNYYPKFALYRYMYLKTYTKFTFCTKSKGHVSDENFLYYCMLLASKICSYGV